MNARFEGHVFFKLFDLGYVLLKSRFSWDEKPIHQKRTGTVWMKPTKKPTFFRSGTRFQAAAKSRKEERETFDAMLQAESEILESGGTLKVWSLKLLRLEGV